MTRAHHVRDGLMQLPYVFDVSASGTYQDIVQPHIAALGDAVTLDLRQVEGHVELEHIEFGWECLRRGAMAMPFDITALVWRAGVVDLVMLDKDGRDLTLTTFSAVGDTGAWAPAAMIAYWGGELRWNAFHEYFDHPPREEGIKNAGNALYSACGAAAFLMSKEARVITEPPPHKLNAARIKRGKSPINETRIIKLRPLSSDRSVGVLSGEGHASPRMHWRRGHFRILHKGAERQRVIPVAPSLVGANESVRQSLPAPKDYMVLA